MWGILKSDGERLKRFADQFLDLEAVTKSQRPLQMEPLAIISVVRALVRKFRTDQHKHRFHVRASKRHLIALADLERVENILRNLLDNAISYAPPGTRITITIKPLPNNLIQVSVQDQGPGVAYEDREKIFEPFYRSARPTSRRVYGHGLGLAIAKRSVIEMGGTIWLDSKLNLGATFHFTLRRYR
jgi:signal transduction histidine kinase